MTTDLRNVVEDDRGIIKKIQLVIPGYRGYRKREDLRIADSLLRNELYKMLGHVESDAHEVQRRLTEGMAMKRMDAFKGVVYDLQNYRNRIRHATQEYTGVSADYRITEEELERMYEYDLRLFGSVDALKREIAAYDASMDDAAFARRVRSTRAALKGYLEALDMRKETVAGILVSK